ncbi:5-3 exoribonuclease [Encephalitozoon intestinalis ATCC 50506]|uniref:5-3 exoribonuclease n=1 Tax=Encephalitozoon intestinalis (strain ATCC 50506) TaxID=876142 RepID=E0S9D7_ENCIT|nr:5-3 exoribonuclease [Encephalitozoon intestinalis ATCC 50506]ADM12201.1 5-3 exoribonuclease [Encephalitozoon intestinalis ATCC 50506]UTX46008.1 5-3 exoribonuclease [Encephalitozoon intestinalis]
MGVPSLFRWLQLSHREAVHSIMEKPSVDCLYLDFNAIIHTCIKPGLGSEEEIERDLYKTVGDFIDYILLRTRPRKLLYIAIDGVAPRAKLSHQRARRYKSALGKKEGKAPVSTGKTDPTASSISEKTEEATDVEFTGESSLYDKFIAEDLSESSSLAMDVEAEKFDLNCITPGTPFMERLHNVLISYIQYKLSKDPEVSHLRIIYSSYLVPGEGEQKIMSFIRNQIPAAKNDVHMIYSPDGDLIFLGLSLYKSRVLIMRDYFSPSKARKKKICTKCGRTGHSNDECGVFDNYHFVYVNIAELRSRLIREFRKHTTQRFNEERLLSDWIFLCFLLGNDFVPSIPCLDIRFHSIDTLTEIMMKNFSETKSYITCNTSINYQVLRNFYTILARKEDGLYHRKSQSLDRLREELKDMPNIIYEKIPIHTKTGKIQYYTSKLNAKTDSDIKNICYEYIKALYWVYSYYILGYTGWDWYYPHHFAPLAADLSKLSISEIRINSGLPLRPLEQLLVVLPPMSKGMVPRELQPIFNNYKDYYPEDVETDMFDKVYLWQEVVLLPFMDFRSILSENASRFNSLGYEDLSRNLRSLDLFFTVDKKSTETILNMYSELKPMCFIKDPGYTGNLSPYSSASFPGDMAEYNGTQFVNRTIAGLIEPKKN